MILPKLVSLHLKSLMATAGPQHHFGVRGTVFVITFPVKSRRLLVNLPGYWSSLDRFCPVTGQT
eukprot:1472762-Amphidinium_carterae.1